MYYSYWLSSTNRAPIGQRVHGLGIYQSCCTIGRSVIRAIHTTWKYVVTWRIDTGCLKNGVRKPRILPFCTPFFRHPVSVHESSFQWEICFLSIMRISGNDVSSYCESNTYHIVSLFLLKVAGLYAKCIWHIATGTNVKWQLCICKIMVLVANTKK